jgi:hypothetical protein
VPPVTSLPLGYLFFFSFVSVISVPNIPVYILYFCICKMIYIIWTIFMDALSTCLQIFYTFFTVRIEMYVTRK